MQAQRWYEQNSLPTKVKACANRGVDEILQLAGVAAFTVVPDDLRLLSSTYQAESEVCGMSLFAEDSRELESMDHPSYIDDEARYRIDFARADDGKAQFKIAQVSLLQRIYQYQYNR